MPDARLGKKNPENATQGTQYPNATYILMQFSFFSLLKLYNLVLSLKKKKKPNSVLFKLKFLGVTQ